MEMEKLKPCPFCRSKDIAVGGNEGEVTRPDTAFGNILRCVPSVRWAYCCECGASGPSVYVQNHDGTYKKKEQEEALKEAIAVWNDRGEE